MGLNEIMGFLGLCRKAGFLQCGHDAAKESIVKGKARLIILASDAAPRLENEMKNLTLTYGNADVIRTAYPREAYNKGVGKAAAVFSVNDNGFANKLRTMFGEE